ncbi:hypothetical protein CSUB01_11043 [Colletotrichum sublineola]|uniref:Uncharacterized protein n=1 Tax=Colletotrichum sublineola TaxID=1173701 RepID=A0A066XI34_COLSU|nr:hypothetical protein CSUB01_11043 [Colletotrichum sublineola]
MLNRRGNHHGFPSAMTNNNFCYNTLPCYASVDSIALHHGTILCISLSNSGSVSFLTVETSANTIWVTTSLFTPVISVAVALEAEPRNSSNGLMTTRPSSSPTAMIAAAEGVGNGEAQAPRHPIDAFAARLGRLGRTLAEMYDSRCHVEASQVALRVQARRENAQCQWANLGLEHRSKLYDLGLSLESG